MSRAGATKGGKDKPKPPASQTPVVATEIVPGKFNESDWNAMVERDNAEDFIRDIIDEMIGGTMDAIFKLYLNKQLLPFTITQAKDAILQIIEWQFLARDEGEEGLQESNWVQDEEPEAVETDCWAQGSVPKKAFLAPSAFLDDVEEEEEEVEVLQKMEEKVEAEEPELEDKVSDGEAPEEEQARAGEEATAAAESKKKREKKKKEEKLKGKNSFKPYRGKLKSAGVSRMTESLEETEMKMYMTQMAASMSPQEISSSLLTMPASCHSILRVQNGRPPGNKEVEFDEMGNVISVIRLDTRKLPNHRVSVKYKVVDPAVEAAQARLEAMRKGRYMTPLDKKLVRSFRIEKSSSDSIMTEKTPSKSTKTRKAQIKTLPPTLLENIEVAPGVMVTEAGRIKKGPGRLIKNANIIDRHQRELQPVTIKIKTNTISVSDLLDRNTPILRAMEETRPLPPIVPTQPGGTQLST